MDELSQNSQELANANTINESNAITPIQIENTEISNVIEDIETHQVPMVEEPLEEEVDENQIIVLTEEEEKKISSYSREELVEKLEYFLQEKELIKAKNSIALLKLNYIQKSKDLKKEALEHFITEGGDKLDFTYLPDEIENRFQVVTHKIKEFHQKQKEENERTLADNLLKKQAVLEQLRQLIETDAPLKQTYDEFHKLQDAWKEIGQIARNEVNNLWQSYHFLVEQFFDKVRINNELRDLDYKKNLEQKLQLCEKVEELLLEESLNKSFKLLQQYHEQWKEIGPVSIDKKDEIWERFKTATDAINLKRKDYYDQMQGAMEQALLAKTAICEKMEILLSKVNASINEWNVSTEEVAELLKVWKTLGRAAQKQNDEIWDRFKGSLNAFYDAKKEYFDKIKDEQINNYNLKLDLCAQAENIAQERTDWRAATDELLRLQKQWKEIGSVPRKYADKIWKRFRVACDAFFDKKAVQHKTIKEQELVNMQAKEALVLKVKELVFTEDKAANLQNIREIQRQWTEIGHVPMKEKDRLYMDFRAAINAQFEKIGMKSNDQRGIMGRISDIEKPEDATHLNRKDISQLSNKINQMKEDISLFENNIGFLSRSKSSDVLRQEFENKIQKAKQELALLEAKYKIIRSAK
ncbi:MAG: DUF349 domain-containing protein [Bacteroidales bacterium]